MNGYLMVYWVHGQFVLRLVLLHLKIFSSVIPAVYLRAK